MLRSLPPSLYRYRYILKCDWFFIREESVQIKIFELAHVVLCSLFTTDVCWDYCPHAKIADGNEISLHF